MSDGRRPRAVMIRVCLLATAVFMASGSGVFGQQVDDGATLSALRSVPAESLIAAVVDPDWQPPRTSWGAPSLEGVWSVDDMRGVPRERDEAHGERQHLTDAEFLERAQRDQGGRNRAENTETFLRNEWGVRTFGFTSLVVEPANGRIPALTAAGEARAQARASQGTFGPGPFDTFEDFSLYDRCITRGIFGAVLPSIYGNGIRIVQSPGKISISYEMIHDTRIIRLDDRSGSAGVDQYMGLSRGRWEGDTLIVEADHFTDRTSVGGRLPHSRRLTLTERYTRVDPAMIEYRATIDDPETFEAPFTYRVMITNQPDYQTYEYSCHEGNGAVGNSLAGERAYARRVEEARANGRPVPERTNGLNVYREPGEGANVFDINAGE